VEVIATIRGSKDYVYIYTISVKGRKIKLAKKDFTLWGEGETL